MQEDKWLNAGNSLEIIPTPWGPVGLAICYDLRFPEMFRKYALQGVKMVLIPAEWPSRRIEHWRVLLRARAIENQMFVVATNCVGGSDPIGGHSAVIDPWGQVIIEGEQEQVLLTTEIDLDVVNQVRERIPVLKEVRPDIYG
jgi:omega-amidase